MRRSGEERRTTQVRHLGRTAAWAASRVAPSLLTTSLLATSLLVAGCSGPQPGPPATSADQPGSASAAPTSEPADAPSATPAGSAAGCLAGRYRLVRFVGVGDHATYGTGEGGDVDVAFDNGAYELTGRGQKPIVVTLAGQRGQLLVDGTAAGDYTAEGESAQFRVGDLTGNATLSAGGSSQTLSMAEVANVIAPVGSATVRCDGRAMIITLKQVRLEFGRL